MPLTVLQLTVEEENAVSGDEDCLDEDEDSLSISLPSDNAAFGPGKGRAERGAGLEDQGRTSALLKDRILKILSTDDEDDERVCSLKNVFLTCNTFFFLQKHQALSRRRSKRFPFELQIP